MLISVFEAPLRRGLRRRTPHTRCRREKKESEASTARLKGNRFYRAKQWDKARELYMTSLKRDPYEVNTLANLAQVVQPHP